MHRRLSLFFTALAAACGGDSTGPGGPLHGDWSYSVTNLASGGVSCSASGTILHFVQNGTALSGTYNGGSWICVGGGLTDTIGIGAGTIVNGQITGATVSFYLDNQDWYSVGTVSGDTMSGTANARFPGSGPPTVLAAPWASGRQ